MLCSFAQDYAAHQARQERIEATQWERDALVTKRVEALMADDAQFIDALWDVVAVGGGSLVREALNRGSFADGARRELAYKIESLLMDKARRLESLQ